ncbi:MULTISPECIES: hypothetical protein [unclassified Micromonospora]|uniref:hypothetical protein n=1 Tax=unclassified Micromonospora TaxID=2617518 RepID=UPI002FF2E4EF
MSYQMWVQRFVDGEPVAMPGEAFAAVFGPYLDRLQPEFRSARVTVPDGGDATVYGYTGDDQLGSLMISRFSPGQVLDLLVEYARRADAVVIPPDCPTMMTSENQRGSLPDELRDRAVVVANGADVEAVLAAG